MTINNDIEQRVLDAIDMQGMLAYLDELVAIQSLDGSTAEVTVQEHVAAQMGAIGLAVEQWELDFEALSRHPAFSVEVDRPRGLGVVGLLGRDAGGQSLILNGHTDVVPAGEVDNWRYPPWRATLNSKEGRVYGRGTLDMKGGLCCALYAAKAIIDAGVQLNGRLLLQSVSGEEDGGVGTLAAVARGYRADAAVIMEPTELMLAPAHAGALNFRITIPGRAAHGAMRSEGVDPLEKFMPIYQAILDLEKARNAAADHPLFAAYELPYPICVGTIRAGSWASTVAESLTFEGRYGVAVGEDLRLARRAFEETIAAAAKKDEWLRAHPPAVQWWGGQFAPAGIPADHPIVAAVGDAFESATGRAPKVQGMPYGADMRLLVNEGGIPTVLFGPGDVRLAHRPDEYVPLEDLRIVTRTLALTILRFCGYT